MGCGELGALIVIGLVIWGIAKAFSSDDKPAGQTWAEQQHAKQQFGHHDPQAARQVKVEIKGNNQRRWARIRVPMPLQMPHGLVVTTRASPKLRVQEGATDERTFYAVIDAQGTEPEALFAWATPQNMDAVLRAWWALRQSFTLRGETIRANISVTHAGDPVIQHAVQWLHWLANSVGPSGPARTAPALADPKPAAAKPAKPAKQVEPLAEPGPPAGPSGDAPAPSSAPPAVAPSPPPSTAAPAAPSASPFTVRTPAASGGGTFSAAPPPWSSSAPGSAPASPSPFSSSPPPPTASPTPAASPEAAADSVAGLLEQLGGDGAAMEALVDSDWKGKRLTGVGKVIVASQIFGTDSDFQVTSGTKLTVEIKVPNQSGLFSPKVVVHLAENGAQLSYGMQVEFSGVVKQYKATLRTLLLAEGAVTGGATGAKSLW